MRFGLLRPAQRPTLDETRPAPFRKADVDDIEVPGDDRFGEDGPRLARDLGSEVAVGEVREHEHLDAGRAGELGCADGSGVQGLLGAAGLLGREGRLVDEHVRLVRRLQHLSRGAGVARQYHFPPRPWRAEDLLRQNR